MDHSQGFEVRSLDRGRGLRADAIRDGCGSFAAGQLSDGRPIPGGEAIAVQQEPPYRTRLVMHPSPSGPAEPPHARSAPQRHELHVVPPRGVPRGNRRRCPRCHITQDELGCDWTAR